MSAASFRADVAALGEKGAGLRLLQAMGLKVAPYRVVPTHVLDPACRALLRAGSTAAEMPAALQQAIVAAYDEVAPHHAEGLVLMRGSLATPRTCAGMTLSDMVSSRAEALAIARRIYRAFFTLAPAPADSESVALILQMPTFQLADLVQPGLLTGILATQGHGLVIEACAAAELRSAPKWWNGTSAGKVSWVLDLEGIRADGGSVTCQCRHAATADTALREPTALTPEELRWIVRTAVAARTRLRQEVCIEWVRTQELIFHQLRPQGHGFLVGAERAGFGPEGAAATWHSPIALRGAPAPIAARLLDPGPQLQPQATPWAAVGGPWWLLSRTRKGDLPDALATTAARMQAGCTGIVDPSLGSRLSHVAAQLDQPYVALPDFDAMGVAWEALPGGGRVSRGRWVLQRPASER